MKTNFNPINKTATFFIMLVIVIIGIGLLAATEYQISSQQVQIITMQKTIKKVNDQIGILTKDNASTNAQIKHLLNQPTPVPEVKYVPQQQQATECPYPYVRTGGKCVNFYLLKGY